MRLRDQQGKNISNKFVTTSAQESFGDVFAGLELDGFKLVRIAVLTYAISLAYKATRQ